MSINGRLVKADTVEYLRVAIAYGRRVLDEYNVGVQNWDDPAVISLLCELFDLTSARLCLVYDLDARYAIQLLSLPFKHFEVN